AAESNAAVGLPVSGPEASLFSANGALDDASVLAGPAVERSRPPRLPRPSRLPRSREPRPELRLPAVGEGPKAELGIGVFGSAIDSRACSAAAESLADGTCVSLIGVSPLAASVATSASTIVEDGLVAAATLSTAVPVGAAESFSVVGSGAVAASGSDSGSGSGVASPSCEAKLNQWRRRGAGLAAGAGFVFAFAAGLGGASAEITSTLPLGAVASDPPVVSLTASSSPAFGVSEGEASAAGRATGSAAAWRPVDELTVAWGAGSSAAGGVLAEVLAEEVAGLSGAVVGAAGGVAGWIAGCVAGCCVAVDFTPRRSASSDQLDFFPESVIRLYASYLS
ncbi:MAG: hypothetical protein ACKO38_12585, partial [Planctomycetota bacterium]